MSCCGGSTNFGCGLSIGSVSPTPMTAGGTVTVTGSGFTEQTQVSFDGVPGEVTYVSGSELTVVVPDTVDPTVTVSVEVVNSFSCRVRRTVVPPDVPPVDPPAPTGLQGIPDTTPVDGDMGCAGVQTGYRTVVVGDNLETATAVYFGDVASPSVSWSHGMTEAGLGAMIPEHEPGVVDIRVVGPGGEGVLADAFEFVAPATVTSVVPAVAAAGATVVITGTGFLVADSQWVTVQFGSRLTARIVPDSATQVKAVVPAGGTGTVAVTVTPVSAYNHYPGCEGTALPGAFTYQEA